MSDTNKYGYEMPRVCAVPVATAVSVVKKFIEHFRTNDFPCWSHDVWKEMAATFNNLGHDWNFKTVYINVVQNRRNILSEARKQMGVVLQRREENNNVYSDSEQQDQSDTSKEESNCSESSCFGLRPENQSIKNMILTEDEWDLIKPAGTNNNLKLTPKEWTNIVASAFWLQYRMPCAFVFKQGRIRYSAEKESYLIKFCGTCKSRGCKNSIRGVGEKKINEKGVTFAIETRDTRHERHEIVKRPFNGKKREAAFKKLKTDGCAKYRKQEARDYMSPGDVEPPIIPSLDVLRQAKKEGIDANLGIKKCDGRDVVKTIEDMCLSPQYSGLIHEVGGLPFRVLYGAGVQFRIYQEYKRINKGRATICVDATGGLVTKLHRTNGTKSGHIFLYVITINFSGTTACVYQMLSERHDSITITMWLLRWIQNGATIPKEAICDYSRALLMALSMAFTKRPIKEYIDDRFRALMDSHGMSKEPTTFIRVDVAHFTHMICRWQCFKLVRQGVIKDFFVRCITLMVESKTVSQFKKLFLLTCAVALHTHEDSVIDSRDVYTPRDARKQLENYISEGNVTEKLKEYEEEKRRNTPFCQDSASAEEDINSEEEIEASNESGVCIRQWIGNLIIEAKKTLQFGENLNAFYLPDFIKQFARVAKEFPLWTSVGMPSDTKRATSSYIEGYFNDLKTRTLKHYKLPISVNKFIREHITDIEEICCIVSGQIVHYNNERLHENRVEEVLNAIESVKKITTTKMEIVEEKTDCVGKPSGNLTENDSDFFAVENWGGKGAALSIDHHQHVAGVLETGWDIVVDGLTTTEKIPAATVRIGPTDEMDYLCNKDNDEPPITDHAEFKLVDYNKITYNSFESDLIQRGCVSSPIKKTIPQLQNKPVTSTSKYYKPYPDIRQDNALVADRKNMHRKRITLLPNGSRCSSIDLKGCSYFIRNTCAFDSIIQILATAGTDNIEYYEFLEHTLNKTLKLVLDFITSGVSKSILTERAEILSTLYTPTVQAVSNDKVITYKINAENNIAETIQKCISPCPSKVVINDCSECGRKTTDYCTIAPNHKTLSRKGLSALQEALEFHSPIYNIRCEDGGRSTRTSNLTEHLFIELDIRDSRNLQKSLRWSLAEFPQRMQFQQTNEKTSIEYRLAGVVQYNPGHYIAHSFRNGGFWDTFNNMGNKKTISNPRTIIEPHLAIYIRKTKQVV